MRENPGRIAFLTTGLGNGGAETQIVRIAVALRRRGWEVMMVSMLSPDAFTHDLAAEGIHLASLGMSRGRFRLTALAEFLRLLRRWRPDVLVSFLFHANVMARFCGRLARTPIVINSVRSANFGGTRRYRLLAITDGLADATTANSRLVAEDLARRGVVPPDKLHVIPNAITGIPERPSPEERARVRGELGVGDDFLFMAVGRADPSKDYVTLLHAMREVVDRSDRACVLRIVGDLEPLGAELDRLAQSLRLADHVSFIGFRPDVSSLLSAADGYVMTSRFEGLPNALMEALAAGLPSVATAVGGIPELIEHGRSGLLVEPGAPGELALALMEILRMSPEDRRGLGRSGQEFVAANFSIDEVTDRWEELIRGLSPRKHLL